jgi:aryl-alcohol dehydrogenase-like predicted oxidoreductase
LTGKFSRDHQFPPGDGRRKYPMFQGDQWQLNQDLLDELRTIAQDAGRSVSQLVLNWTIQQPGITAALCGAKRPDQLRDNAGAMGWRLSPDHQARLAAALARRGTPVTRPAV